MIGGSVRGGRKTQVRSEAREKKKGAKTSRTALHAQNDKHGLLLGPSSGGAAAYPGGG